MKDTGNGWEEKSSKAELLDEIAALGFRVTSLKTENEALRATLRIDWEVIVDAIDDHDIKQAAIRLWNRADALLKETP